MTGHGYVPKKFPNNEMKICLDCEPKLNAELHLHKVAEEYNSYYDSNYYIKEFTCVGNGLMISIKEVEVKKEEKDRSFNLTYS